jgi:hypothetical protein
MKNRISVFTAVIVLLISVGILFVVYQINPVKSIAQLRAKREEVKTVKFFNKTNSFEIINHKISGKEMELTLRNNYDKSINGFCVMIGSLKEGSGDYVELVYSGIRNEIRPNETYTYRMGVNEKIYTEGLTISAVLFTDHSGDGDPEPLGEMLDKREGEKFQLSRGFELLKATIDSSSVDYASEMENLKNDFSSFETDNKTRSNAYNYGLQTGKSTLIRYIERLEINRSTDESVTKQKFSELQSKLEIFISKL